MNLVIGGVALAAFGSAALAFIINVLIAIVILLVGNKLIKYIVKLFYKMTEKANVDAGVKKFLASIIRVVLYAVLVVIIAEKFGIDTTSFIAVLGSAGLAVGLALQGSLSNFAGGVLILVLHPFRVGDYIVDNSTGREGTVEEIALFCTKLVTPDNKLVTIPNGSLSNAAITNVTAKGTRRLDLVVGIGYSADLKLAKKLIVDIVSKREKVLKDQDITVFVDNLGASSVDIGFRCWVDGADYWTEKWEITEAVKEAFDANGIEIPFNQLDVHMKSE